MGLWRFDNIVLGEADPPLLTDFTRRFKIEDFAKQVDRLVIGFSYGSTWTRKHICNIKGSLPGGRGITGRYNCGSIPVIFSRIDVG